MLREVILHGELARRYGKVHRFDVKSPAEAVRALDANFPGFSAHLATSHRRGVGYQVWDSGRNVGEDDLALRGTGRIYLSPVMMGSKRGGIFQTILGTALTAIGIAMFFIPGTQGIAPYVTATGASMMLGGIAQLLTPTPKTQSGDQAKSDFFNGPVNTASQGNPVPVGYGTMLIGGAVISAGISIDQVAVDAS